MEQEINAGNALKRVELNDGSYVLLFDRLAKEKVFGRLECARNIYHLSATGELLWQVATPFDADSGPFTNIFFDGRELKGYRWDGGTYLINQETGIGMPCRLER